MADVLNPNPVSPPRPSSPNSEQKSNMPMFYYGIVVVGTAAVALALYNLIVIKRCGRRHILSPSPSSSSSQANQIRVVEAVRAPYRSSFDQAGLTNFRNMAWSFKYKRGEGEGGRRGRECDCECVVCLSGFEEGEEVRKLPRCNHCFHAECIDMWLCSHFDCPICRMPVLLFSRPSPADISAINGVGV